jgi:hypothetical protein
MTAAILSAIQRDAFVWQKRNFGEPNGLLMLVGMGEEYGESQEFAADTDRYLDSVGDAAIYLMQFCSIRGWDIGDLWNRRDLYELPPRAWPVLAGKINHHHAKALTRYRGPAAEHDERCRAAISALLRHWELHLADMRQDFIATVQKTWAEVAARDWTPESMASAEPTERRECTTGGCGFEAFEDYDDCAHHPWRT